MEAEPPASLNLKLPLQVSIAYEACSHSSSLPERGILGGSLQAASCFPPSMDFHFGESNRNDFDVKTWRTKNTSNGS